jgi:primosomal protein N''
MGADAVPFYLKAQLKTLVQECRTMAEEKGLTQAFEMDLFALERTAEEMLVAGDKESVERALAQAKDLEARLRAAPRKSDPLLLR